MRQYEEPRRSDSEQQMPVQSAILLEPNDIQLRRVRLFVPDVRRPVLNRLRFVRRCVAPTAEGARHLGTGADAVPLRHCQRVRKQRPGDGVRHVRPAVPYVRWRWQ